MLIAWQTVNAVRRPGSRRFTHGFLVVAPGLTIRDRYGHSSKRLHHRDRSVQAVTPTSVGNPVRLARRSARPLRAGRERQHGWRRRGQGRPGRDLAEPRARARGPGGRAARLSGAQEQRCRNPRIGKTTGRSRLSGEYWCGRYQVNCRSTEADRLHPTRRTRPETGACTPHSIAVKGKDGSDDLPLPTSPGVHRDSSVHGGLRRLRACPASRAGSGNVIPRGNR